MRLAISAIHRHGDLHIEAPLSHHPGEHLQTGRALVLRAGRLRRIHRKCHPHQATLAKRLGVSERTIRRWLSQLIDLGYISVRRTGRGSWCTLAWVGVESDRTGTSDQGPEKDVRSDTTSVSGAYKEEPRSWTGNPSSSSTAGEGRGPRPRDDDDDQEPPQERKTQNPSPGDPLVREVRGTLEAWFERRGSPKPLNRPSDPIPDEVIADELGKRHASILELKDFLDGDYTSAHPRAPEDSVQRCLPRDSGVLHQGTHRRP